MHIAFLSSEYPPLPSGGIGTSIRNLARALVTLGHRVTVIGWGSETAFEDEGVRVRFLGHTRIPKLGWFLNRWRVAREINRLVHEEGLDIVEAPDWCGMSAGLRPGTSGNAPQTIDRGPTTTDQGPRSVEAGEQSPERSERGSCSKTTPSLPAAAAFVPGSVAPPAVSRSPLSAFRFPAFLLRHLGFRIHCPLVIRCHGTATYFAYLERLQEQIDGVSISRQPAEDVSIGHPAGGPGGGQDAIPLTRRKLRVKPLVRWTEWLALHQACSVVAVSRFCAETTAGLFGLQGNRSLFTAHCSLITDHRSPITALACPIGVIPNGIDLCQFTPARPEEIEPDTILYFGTLVRKKGVLELPAIFSRVIEQVPQARLRLIGRDNPAVRTGAPSTWELMQRDFSPAARSRVEYLGTKPYSEIQEHVRRAGVCIFPSYAEAFPVSWLEAMACGKPVVAYDIGWAQEVVESGVSGSLVRPGDTAAFANAVVACLQDPQHAANMGLVARRRVEQLFTANAVAKRSLAWYACVCQGL